MFIFKFWQGNHIVEDLLSFNQGTKAQDYQIQFFYWLSLMINQAQTTISRDYRLRGVC